MLPPDSDEAMRIRLAAKLSQEELAELIGVSCNCLYRWERGDRMPSPGWAIRYLDALEKLSQG